MLELVQQSFYTLHSPAIRSTSHSHQQTQALAHKS